LFILTSLAQFSVGWKGRNFGVNQGPQSGFARGEISRIFICHEILSISLIKKSFNIENLSAFAWVFTPVQLYSIYE